jgi:seryl-tRNA synthetase
MDLAAARREPDRVRAALERKGAGALFDEVLDLDRRKREVQARAEQLRAARKVKGKPTPEQLEQLARTKEELQAAEAELAPLEDELARRLERLPNPPEDEAPTGGEDDFVVLREVGEPPSFDFEPTDHLELAGAHGWIDLERGAKVSGSRFAYRVGDLALTELALYRWALDRLAAKGFTPVLPPVLVREPAMYGTGFLPTDEVNIYRVERDDLYLTGTSEVALAAFHADEILDDAELPLRYAGYSTNFRREAGAAGKDTRGMFRVHQFDKVEMFVVCRPEESQEIHRDLLAIEEELVDELGLPYRVIDVAAGDLGASAARKFDVEAWFPGQGRYREITSTSNTTDFQARRLQVRFRRDGGRPEHVHTLNGTAVTARALLATMETFQQADGSIAVPDCLVDFGAPTRLGAHRTPVS